MINAIARRAGIGPHQIFVEVARSKLGCGVMRVFQNHRDTKLIPPVPTIIFVLFRVRVHDHRILTDYSNIEYTLDYENIINVNNTRT